MSGLENIVKTLQHNAQHKISTSPTTLPLVTSRPDAELLIIRTIPINDIKTPNHSNRLTFSNLNAELKRATSMGRVEYMSDAFPAEVNLSPKINAI